MCIFSEETIAKETIIAAGYNHIAYQNKVEMDRDSVMIMPVPGTDVKFLQLPDGALDDLADQWKAATDWVEVVTRGAGHDKSEVVGQYTIHYTDYPRLKLIDLGQPVYRWMDEIESRYDGWSFVLIEMKKGQSIKNQPWFVTFTPIKDDYIFVPMYDVHGNDEPDHKVYRNHLVLVNTPISDGFLYDGPVDAWKGGWDGFDIGYKSPKISTNGDLHSTSKVTIGYWKI